MTGKWNQTTHILQLLALCSSLVVYCYLFWKRRPEKTLSIGLYDSIVKC